MNANHVLFWASALGTGTWHQFKSAVERLHLEDSEQEEAVDQKNFPLYQKVRLNLQRLGHVEFNGQEDGWRVVPPVFAITQREGRIRAVLCGARSEPLLARIREASNGLGLLETPCDACPDIICLEDWGSDRIEQTAKRLGILVQPSAPEAILINLPPVESLVNWVKGVMPFGEGWNKERFCVQTLSWQGETGQQSASGGPELLHFTRVGKPRYFIRMGTSGIEVPVQMGKFFVLMSTRRRVMFFNRKGAELSFRPICRPPLFVERALCMYSGFPAAFDPEQKVLVYKDIPEHVAQLAARNLRQEIL